VTRGPHIRRAVPGDERRHNEQRPDPQRPERLDERPSKRTLASAARQAARTALRPLSFRVLRALDDVAFTSGNVLASSLGVSRSTVWAAVGAIERAGVQVLRGRGRGYRLVAPLMWIDAPAVQQMLGRAAEAMQLTVVDHCESTNTSLARQAEAGAPHGTVLLAEWQTAGRGRMGRHWASAPGAGLTFSVLWRFEKGAMHLSGLSLVVGLAIADALRMLGLHEVRLKWPNDVLVRRHKLAGVLTEIKGDMLGPCAAVIGIGLNVALPARVIASIDQPVTDLARSGLDNLDRNAILTAVLSGLATTLARFEREGFPAFRQQWQAHSASHNRMVRVVLPGGEVVRGRMTGVDDQGALRVDTGEQTVRVFSGELLEARPARAGSSASVSVAPPAAPGKRPQQAEIE